MVVAQEPGGALGGLVRQLSLDQFENEGRRVSYGNVDSGIAARRLLDRQMSTRGLHKKVHTLSSYTHLTGIWLLIVIDLRCADYFPLAVAPWLETFY